MITIDLQKMVEINEGLYTSAAKTAFGDDGGEALKQLLAGVVHIYRRLDPSLRSAPLVLFADVGTVASTISGTPHRLQSIANLAHELDAACMARVKADYSLEIYPLDSSTLNVLSQTAIVYYFSDGIETVLIAGKTFRLKNPVIGCVSVFSKPTYSSLSTALDNYRLKAAAYSSCLILKDVWNEQPRWFFKSKPEYIMRRSLTQYLSSVLSEAEVRPEQNVDESHPVDIHVSFSLTDQRAIIEIKWLGDSVSDKAKITTLYRPARALDGAKQLAEYLDGSQTWGPGVKTRGYLVVFDGRRKGLAENMTSLSPEDALHYKDAEIEYDPDYSNIRDDFHRPVRMYMWPLTA